MRLELSYTSMLRGPEAQQGSQTQMGAIPAFLFKKEKKKLKIKHVFFPFLTHNFRLLLRRSVELLAAGWQLSVPWA